MRLKILGIQLRFTTNWKLMVFYLLFMPLFLGLGYWQLNRAAEKSELEYRYQLSIQGEPISLDVAVKDPGIQKVELFGRFDKQRHFLLDNRTYRGAAGYEVISLLRLNHSVYLSDSDGGNARPIDYVWVSRGWISAGASRQELPTFETPSGELRLLAIIDESPEDAFVLKDLPYSGVWPEVIQRVDLARMQQGLNRNGEELEVLPVLLRLRPESPGSFQLIWNPIVMPSKKHLGYALQWFSMCAALTILYLFVSVKRSEDD